MISQKTNICNYGLLLLFPLLLLIHTLQATNNVSFSIQCLAPAFPLLLRSQMNKCFLLQPCRQIKKPTHPRSHCISLQTCCCCKHYLRQNILMHVFHRTYFRSKHSTKFRYNVGPRHQLGMYEPPWRLLGHLLEWLRLLKPRAQLIKPCFCLVKPRF